MPHVVPLLPRRPRPPRRRGGGRAAAVTALVLLLSGALVAWALDGVLGLSFTPKTVPAEHFGAVPATAPQPPPRITAITGADSPRLRLAAQAVADALAARGRPSPALRSGARPTAVPAGVLAVRAGSGGSSAEQYRLRASDGGLLLDAAGQAGAAAGLYRLADRVRSGEDAMADVPLAVGGAAAWATGTERALSAWNDQMTLLPWGLHRILGITTYLGVPTSLPRDVALAGAALVLLGAALGVRRRVGRTG
ncbi:hypothetical protein [Actinacidiphila rubida]|nr:hypothetical protein [Actinacidiphila rubida]